MFPCQWKYDFGVDLKETRKSNKYSTKNWKYKFKEIHRGNILGLAVKSNFKTKIHYMNICINK